MVSPSPVLSARLRLTTKQVGRGYYKGNRTGSMGAHTRRGGYLIDYRKTRNFNCPTSYESNVSLVLASTFLRSARLTWLLQLTPYVDAGIPPQTSARWYTQSPVDLVEIKDGRSFLDACDRSRDDGYHEKLAEWKKYLEEVEKEAAKQDMSTSLSNPVTQEAAAADNTKE